MHTKFLKLVDFYPQDLIFTYKGRKKIKTIWGGIISLFSIFIIIINAIIIGKDIYLKNDPNVIYSQKIEKEVQIDRLNLKRNTLAFAFHRPLTGVFWDESAIQVIPYITIGKLDKDGNTKFREYELAMNDCYKEYQRLNKTINAKVLYLGKCIKDLDIFLGGNWVDEYFSTLTVHVRTCRNETYPLMTNALTKEENDSLDQFEKDIGDISEKHHLEDHELKEKGEEKDLNFFDYLNHYKKKLKENRKNKTIICKPQKEIEELVEDLNADILYDEISFNPKNYNDPIILNPIFSYFLIGNQFIKNYKYFFESFSIMTDDGIIFNNDREDLHTIAIKESKYDFSLKTSDNPTLAYFEFFNTKKHNLITRRYIKVQNIFANLGGFINLTFLFFNIISIPFFNKKIKLKVINELFDFYDKKKLHNICVKNSFKLENFLDKDKENIKELEISKNFGNKNDKNERYFEGKLENRINNHEIPFEKNKENNINISNLNLNSNINSNILNNSSFIPDRKKGNDLIEINLVELGKEYKKTKNNNNAKDNNDISSRNLNTEEPQKIIKFLKENNGKKDSSSSLALEKKINKIYKFLMNKIKFSNFEIFRSSYNLTCFNQKLKRKKLIYDLAIKDIYKGTDYLEIVKLNKNFKILQYLLLEKEQINMFPFISNPRKFNEGYSHELKNYAEIFSPEYDMKENIWKMKEYFNTKFNNRDLDRIDYKLWGILHPKIKKLIDNID